MSCKPKSRGLRMADGGELMKRFASRQPTLRAADGGMFVPGENQGGANAQMYGRMSADLAQPAAATPTVDPGRRDRMLSAAHSVPQFQPMAVPGLRDGGDLRTGVGGNVPSQGHAQSEGDTIPARYTPGEFVVSNDMLDAAPQLRSQLRDLRGNVLAAKGMTPEQADAKALGYDGGPSGGQDGQQEAGLPGRPGNRRGGSGEAHGGGTVQAGAELGRGAGTGLRGQLDGAGVLGWSDSAGLVPGGGEQPRSRLTLRANDGFGFDPSKYTPPKVDPGTGAYTAGVAPAAVPVQPEAPTAAKPLPAAGTLSGSKYSTLRKAGSVIDSVGRGVTGIYSGVKSVGPGLAAGAAGGYAAQQAQSIGDPTNSPNGSYKPPSAVDQIPTDGYNPAPAAQKHNWFTDNETGRNVGNTITALSGVPGVGALGNTLRSAGAARTAAAGPVLGAALLGANESIKSGRDQPQTPSAPTLREPNPQAASPVQAQAQAPTLRDPGQVDVTRQANGNLSFSGKDISGPVSYTGDGAKDRPGLRNPGSTFSVMPAQDTSSLRNPDGSTWSAGDNAIMAANLRDGVDKYRGTSRGNPTEEAIPAIGEFGHNKAVAARQAERNNQTTLRGQTLQSQDNRYGHELSTQSNMMRLRQEQFQNDRTYNAGRDDANFTQKQAAQKQAVDDIADSLPPVMVDGKPTRDLAGAAQHLDAQNRLVASQIAQAKEHLKLNPNDARMASVLRGLEQRGIAMLSPEAKKRAAQGVGARNMVNETATGAFNPIGTSAVATNDPVTSLRKRGNDYITQTGDVVPKRHVDKEGGVFGFGGRPSLRFNDLITEGERLDATKK